MQELLLIMQVHLWDFGLWINNCEHKNNLDLMLESMSPIMLPVAYFLCYLKVLLYVQIEERGLIIKRTYKCVINLKIKQQYAKSICKCNEKNTQIH